MDTEKLLLILKLRQISKYLTTNDVIELSLTCSLIYNQLKSIILSIFCIKSSHYKKFYDSEENMKKFETNTNCYLNKNGNFIKFLTISLSPTFCKVCINWDILNRLTSISLIGRIKLDALNNLLNLSNYLLKLTLTKIEVAIKICNETASNYISLPPTLVELNIYNLIWAVVAFNRNFISKQTELGDYLFGKNLKLPRLKSLTWIQPSRGPKAMLNFLISKAPSTRLLNGEGEVFNNITYELLNTNYIYLTSLSLIFNDNRPITMEIIDEYKFAPKSELIRLINDVCSNSLRLYLIVKSCPSLTELKLYLNNIDIGSLRHLLPLLPNIQKLTLINHFKGINIKKLNFSNSTINHLTLSKFGTISLSLLIENLKKWTVLNRISIEPSGGGIIVDDSVKHKLESGSNPWKCFTHINSIQLWIK